VVDVTAKAYAESRLQQEINHRSAGDVHVHANIASFPFLGRLAVQQQVHQVELTAPDINTGPLTVENVRLVLDGVRINRNTLVKDQQVVVEKIAQGRAEADITEDSLSNALGTRVRIGNGKVSADVLGHTVSADVAVKGNELTLKVPGLPLPALAVPGSDLLPCLGEASIGDGRIHFSCAVHGIPPVVVNLVNGQST
jgi:hypothetical protein